MPKFNDTTIYGNLTVNGTITGNINTGNITFGTQANKATITYPTNAARTFTIPHTNADADFVMTQGNQMINGIKTLNNGIILPYDKPIDFGADSETQIYKDSYDDRLHITNGDGIVIIENGLEVVGNLNLMGMLTLTTNTTTYGAIYLESDGLRVIRDISGNIRKIYDTGNLTFSRSSSNDLTITR